MNPFMVWRRSFAGLATPQATRIFPGVKRHCELVIESGKGSEVWTKEGKRYLDFASGIGVLSTGHCHPTVVKAVQEQAGKITHAQQSCYYNTTVNELIERLVPIVPEGLHSFFFCNSGAEAVEAAMKLARQAKRRDSIIAFQGGYHGRTQGTLAVTSSSSGYRGERSGPLPSGTAWARYPYEHHGVLAEHSFESLELVLLQQAKASDVAAVLIEPVLGEGGYVVPPEGFMRKLKHWCVEHDILLIADEVQCGFGRTGKQWACEHFHVVPDILVSAKGIASGYPLAMVVSRPDITSEQQPGCMGGTYGGNAVAAAAAIATLDVFEQEHILENVSQRGHQLKDRLRSMGEAAEETVGDIRGLGLMVAVEFDQQITGKGFVHKVTKECFDRGVIVLATGHKDTIRAIPPLVVTEKEVDEFADVLESAITAALKQKQ